MGLPVSEGECVTGEEFVEGGGCCGEVKENVLSVVLGER